MRGARVEGGVLHGVGELVGVGDLRLGGEARIGHHHHALVLEIVEAQHLPGVQLLGQLPDVLVLGQQPHRTEREVVVASCSSVQVSSKSASSSTASSSRVMTSGGPMSGAGRSRRSDTCCSIWANSARASAELTGVGSGVAVATGGSGWQAARRPAGRPANGAAGR